MKTVRTLILSSAASLLAFAGAQAADLPVKAKAVEYVRICSLYGAGFFYIPGTDTCIKLGGYLRVDTTFNGGVYGQPFYSGDAGQGNRFRDYFNSRSRLAITVDTRTATEYGVVRTVAGFATGSSQATAAGANAYGGTHAPDIVGNIRVDQAWGLFQISGMAHLVNASYNILGAGGVPTALSEIGGHPDDKWGGAVMAALQIKNLPTGAGDDFKIDVSYSKGDTKAVISTSGGSPSFAMFGSTGRAGASQSIGFGQTADAVFLPGFLTGGATGDLKLVDAWGVR